jgi:hypothetical protein
VRLQVFEAFAALRLVNTSGGYDILFPGTTGSQNKLESGREYVVPAIEGWFRIAGPPGQEVVYWLMSPVPLTDSHPHAKLPHTPANPSSGPAMIPRCDATILQARGDCLDTSAGPKKISPTAGLPDVFSGMNNVQSRDLVFIRQMDVSIVTSFAPLSEPMVYEFRLAHR